MRMLERHRRADCIAVRNLCNFRLRTASGPEGSSAKQILTCAAGTPDRGGARNPKSDIRNPKSNELPGHRAEMAAAEVRRRRRTAGGDADAAQCAGERAAR